MAAKVDESVHYLTGRNKAGRCKQDGYKGPELRFCSRRSAALGTRGMVAASQHIPAQIGVEIMEKGGNAMDACVAVAAALNVTEPVSTGIGGDMFCIFYDAKTKKVEGINGTGRAPTALTLEKARRDVNWDGVSERMPMYHAHTVTVPGACAGWIDSLERWGTMTPEEVLTPAIKLAEEGVPVNVVASYLWNQSVAFEAQLGSGPFGGELLKPNGQPPQLGDVWKNPTLAQTFRKVAKHGKDGFYKGDVAEAIIGVQNGLGGCMTMQDLAEHKSTFVEPLSVKYRDIDVWEIPPNGQGITALMALNMLNQLEPSEEHNSPEHLHKLIEVMRLAFADARWFVSDPDFPPKFDHAKYLSQDYARERIAKFNPKHATVDVKKGSPFLKSDTVSFCAVDPEGNACSFINSNYNGLGSGIVPKGCGFTLQNRGYGFSLLDGHPSVVAPQKRPYHTIIPGMATRNGELYCPFSVQGGFNQPQGHTQVIVNMVDFGMDPQQALDAPRFCIQAGEPTGIVSVEESLPQEVVDALRKKGHPIKVVTSHGRRVVGRGQIIKKDANGVLWGGSDGNGDGSAIPMF